MFYDNHIVRFFLFAGKTIVFLIARERVVNDYMLYVLLIRITNKTYSRKVLFVIEKRGIINSVVKCHNELRVEE